MSAAARSMVAVVTGRYDQESGGHYQAVTLQVCDECGVVVGDARLHGEWHAAAKSDARAPSSLDHCDACGLPLSVCGDEDVGDELVHART